MSDYMIYCQKKTGIDDIVSRIEPFGFKKEDSMEWELRLSTFANNPTQDKRRYGGIDVCYAPWPPDDEYRLPARIEKPQSVFQITASSKRPQDCLFTGIVAGVLAESYHGDIFDEELSKILYQFPKIQRPVQVTVHKEVLKGLKGVRNSSLTSMLDRPMVIKLATEFGIFRAAQWIESHKKDYSKELFQEFNPEKME